LTQVAPRSQASSVQTAAAIPAPRIALPVTAVRQEKAAAVALAGPKAAPAAQALLAPEAKTPAASLEGLKDLVKEIAPVQGQGYSGKTRTDLGKRFDGGAAAQSLEEPVAALAPGARSIPGLIRGSAAEGRSGKTLSKPELKGLKVFLTRSGMKPVPADMASLAQVFAADPSLAEGLNKGGRIRLVLGKGNPHPVITAADVDALRGVLRSLGISAKLEVETLPVDWQKKGEGTPASSFQRTKQSTLRTALLLAPAALGAAAFSLMTWSALDLGAFFPIVIVTLALAHGAFLVKSLLGSFTRPTWGETLGGILSKAVPTFMGVAAFVGMYAGHPLVMGAAIGITLALNVFHGIWINTWNNFQNNLGKSRGIQYQSMFNLVYGQLWGLVFRSLAWSVIAGTVPVWSLLYWKDLGIATVVGSFFGTLGYQGMNILYDKGRIPRWQRSAIQQLRDIFFVMAGIYLGSGNMFVFWSVFAMQQGLDLGIYLLSRWADRRHILYIADETLAARPEFQDSYPVKDRVYEEGNPLKDALGAILGSPVLKPIVLLVQWLRGKLKRAP
jgi:hypothetical protein